MENCSVPSFLEIDPNTQALILQVLTDLPLKDWLPENATPDQVNFWGDLKIVNIKLRHVFEKYFQGMDASTPVLNKKEQKLLELERDSNLYFYKMLCQGWPHIEQAFGDTCEQYGMRTPGETLIKVLALNCKAAFSTCLHYSEFKPSQAYDLYLERKKHQNLDASAQTPQRSKQSAKHEEKLRQHKAKVKAIRQPYKEVFAFEDELTNLCARAGENDPILKQCVKDFMTQSEQSHESQMRCFSKIRGYRFNRGIKEYALPQGGLYEQKS
jgi:hypothetical protein